MSDKAYTYNKTKNPDGRHFPGVPLADLTTEQVELMPEWLQKSIADAAFYEAVKTTSKKEVKDG